MSIQAKESYRRPWYSAPSGAVWPEAGPSACRSAAAVVIRRTSPVVPIWVRSYFTTCARYGWQRLPVRLLCESSGIPFQVLKRWLSLVGLTPAGVAAWYLALHATWLLDVAGVPAAAVVERMRLRRTTALGSILGARGIRFSGGRVAPGAFAGTLERYLHVLRAAFPA
jgi:hypothetical protein